MTATASTAHFTITGAAFTKLVRSRMLDDAPGSAFRLASSIIADDPLDQLAVPSFAIRLCNGTAKMKGNESDLQLVDDETKQGQKYRDQVKWLFAGRIRIGTKWCQPTAWVSDVGPHDVGSKPRAKHYCGPDEIVAAFAGYPDPQFPSIKREVIFVMCGERPHWHEVPRGTQEALEEYLAAGRGLEERSHSETYRNDDLPPIYRKPDEPPMPGRGPARFKGTYDKDVGLHVDDPAYEAEAEKRYAEEDASRLRYVADLRKLILAQAGDDLIEFSWPDKWSEYEDPPVLKVAAGKTMIPRAPFLIWAFARMTYLKMKLPEWKTISPSSMKMQMDDENHTDWIIGGGFDPRDREFYSTGVYNKAAEDLRSKLQDEHDDRRRAQEEKVTTLVVGAVATGPAYRGKMNKASPPGSVVILPNLNPKYLQAVVDAVAVITEEGGEVAHLAQVGRERGLPIVRRPDAREHFGEKHLVEVNAEARTAKIIKYFITDPSDVEDDND